MLSSVKLKLVNTTRAWWHFNLGGRARGNGYSRMVSNTSNKYTVFEYSYYRTICDVNWVYSMFIGHSMDIVKMPKVPGYHTKFSKIESIHAVDTISVLLGPIMQFFRKWAWLHNVFRFEEIGGKYAAEVRREQIQMNCFNKLWQMLRKCWAM